MTFYRIIFHLVGPCTSSSQPYADVPNFHMLSFAFWWCTYSTFIWLLPTLFFVLLIFLSYFVFLLPPLHSGDIPTVSSSDFYCPLLRSADVHTLFYLLLSPFFILVMYPQYLPLTSTYPLLHSADCCHWFYHCFLFLIRFPSLSSSYRSLTLSTPLASPF